MLLRSNGGNGKSHKSKYTDEPDQLEHEEPPCSTNRTHVQLIRGLSPYRDCCIQTINQREGRFGVGGNRAMPPSCVRHRDLDVCASARRSAPPIVLPAPRSALE